MELMECSVCMEQYKLTRLPRTLSCQHTFCTRCISQILMLGPLKCPYCRGLHRGVVLCHVDIPINEELAKKVMENERDQSNDSSSIRNNILRLREDVREANEGKHPLWTVHAAEGGRAQHSRISLLNNRLHLHVLQDGEPPPGRQTIPYSKIQELQDDDFCILFLDVSWRGVNLGRVYISLLDKEGRALQFKALCTGTHGPSYLGTCFLEVSNKGQAGEKVWGGDYENNDGSGGTALPGMDRGRANNQDIVPGLVVGFYFSGYGEDHNPSLFAIYTRDMPGFFDMSCLGKVLEGMDVVSTVVNLQDPKGALISDCGLLLNH